MHQINGLLVWNRHTVALLSIWSRNEFLIVVTSVGCCCNANPNVVSLLLEFFIILQNIVIFLQSHCNALQVVHVAL